MVYFNFQLDAIDIIPITIPFSMLDVIVPAYFNQHNKHKHKAQRKIIAVINTYNSEYNA